MPRRYAFAARPGWLLLHVITVALVITMVLLGRWQLHVSEAKHFSVQNFGYALQWWAFSGFVLIMWGRVMRDKARHPDGADIDAELEAAAIRDEPVTYRRYVMPTLSATPDPELDETQTAYNAYLQQLNAADTGGARRTEESPR